MKKERKRLNKKIVAFILALSMVFGQTSVLFATESGNSAEPAAPAVEETVTPEGQTDPAAEEGQTDPAAPADALTPGDTKKAEGTEPEEPALKEASEPEKAGEEAVKEEQKSGENEETSGAVSEEKIPELAKYKKGEDVWGAYGQSTNVIRKVGDLLVLKDLKVISGNVSTPSENTPLKEGTDYYLNYLFGFTVSSGDAKAEFDKLPESGNGFDKEVFYDNDEAYILASVSGDAIKEFKPTHTGDFDVAIIGMGDYAGDSIFVEGKVGEKEVKPEHEVSEADIGIEKDYKSITIENKTDHVIYATVLEKSADISSNKYEGNYVGAGEKLTMFESMDASRNYKLLTASTNYVLAASSWDPVSMNTCYKKEVTTDAFPDIFKTDAKDGSVINFKAVVNKADQKVRLSWAPAKDLGYSSYKLERFDAKGLKFDVVASSVTKKSYVDKADTTAEKTPLYKLTCTKKAGGTDEYMTVIAPSMLYVENGYNEATMNFRFSKLNEDMNLSYILQAAEKNKESTGKTEVGKRGFAETSANQVTVNSTFVGNLEDYQISKNLKIMAAEAFYESQGTDFTFAVGNTYYFRMKTTYKFGDKTFTSGPSNVLSRKDGPAQCYIYTVNGVKFTKNKKDENMSNMDKYLKELFDINTVEYEFKDVSFVHDSNDGPDAKSGYAVVLVPSGGTELKSLELLRSDTENGTYKKVKAYSITESALNKNGTYAFKWSYDASDAKYSWLKGYDVYYVQYGAFVPEKTQYYSIRAVAKTKSSVGGMGYGIPVKTELDKVQKLCAVDPQKQGKEIDLFWKHDDCAKKYKIYRKV